MGLAVDLDVGQHISGTTTASLVRWVRSQSGDAGVDRVLAHAGEKRPVVRLEDDGEWSSYRQATSLLEAAVQVTGRTDAARRIGEEMLTQHRGTQVIELLRALGSPEALLSSIAATASKVSTVFSMSAVAVGAGQATVIGTTPPGVPRHRLLCDFTQGVLSVVPTMFDLAPAMVTQSECQARGGTRCVYQISWDPSCALSEAGLEQRVERLEDRLTGLRMQLDALRATGTDVVTAPDLDTALDLVGTRAGRTVRATQYVLAAHLPGEKEPRIRAWGLSVEDARDLVSSLHDAPPSPSRLVAEVASHARRYGVLVALLPPHSSFFAHEQELLSAYAGWAAAALDTAWALADARQQNQTALALLDLSRVLSQVGTAPEVAQRLATALPGVVDCDHAAVLLWDAAGGCLTLNGHVNLAAEIVADLTVGIAGDDTPALAAMVTSLEPLFLTSDEPDDYLRRLVRRSASDAAVVVPIVHTDRFLGVITCGVEDRARLERSTNLLERLEGVAHQAGTALTNALLVGQLQQQAMHDALTGLPNRAALLARLDAALTAAPRDSPRCALLFIDLDGFKTVNDTFGHLAGDELLVQVGHRLRATAPEGAFVARLGGDEFAILLPSITDPDRPTRMTSEVAAAVGTPYRLDEADITVSCVLASVGVACSGPGADTATALLRSADRAMYAAKSRAQAAIGTDPAPPRPRPGPEPRALVTVETVGSPAAG